MEGKIGCVVRARATVPVDLIKGLPRGAVRSS